MKWPEGGGIHKVAFDATTKSVGFQAYKLQGANLTITPQVSQVDLAGFLENDPELAAQVSNYIDGGQNIRVEEFAVENRELAIRVETSEDPHDAVRIRVKNAPEDLLLNVTTSLMGVFDGAYFEPLGERSIGEIEIKHRFFGEQNEMTHRFKDVEPKRVDLVGLVTSELNAFKIAASNPISTVATAGVHIVRITGPSTSLSYLAEDPMDTYVQADLDGDSTYGGAPIPTILRLSGATNLTIQVTSADAGLEVRVPGRARTAGVVLVNQSMWEGGVGTSGVGIKSESTCTQSVPTPTLTSAYQGATYNVRREWLREVLCLA